MKTIGNYEARTHWSEMLQDVKAGEQYVILHGGEPIAQLIPPQTGVGALRARETVDDTMLIDFC